MTDQTAWLIEWPASDNLPPRWWHPVRGWCIDANKATWFVRSEDAHDYIEAERFVRGVKPTEHVFIALRTSGGSND